MFIKSLKEPYKSQAIQLYNKYKPELRKLPASNSHHSNYPGGLYDHTLNVMICTKELYICFSRIFDMYHTPLGFSYSKAIFTAFCHDLTKIYQYTKKPYRHHTKWSQQLFFDNKIKVDDMIINAMFNHHGSYGNRRGNPNALSYIIHFADVWSSQILEVKE